MIKVYRLNRKGNRKLMTTFLDDQPKDALSYAESRARRTREDHVVVYGDGTDKFIFGDLSRLPF